MGIQLQWWRCEGVLRSMQWGFESRELCPRGVGDGGVVRPGFGILVVEPR